MVGVPAAVTAARKAGLEGVSVHTLQHSAATLMLESGYHLPAVSAMLGHSDTRITGDIYGHLSEDVARSAMDTLASRWHQTGYKGHSARLESASD